MINNYTDIINLNKQKIRIIFKSLLVGIIAGCIVTLYRVAVAYAEYISYYIYGFLRADIIWLPVWLVVLVLASLFITALVARCKMIEGSGIPQVKGIIRGYLEDNWLKTLSAKFLGGVIAILAGLSLGRAGPSIQLGACIGNGVADNLAKTRTEKKHLIAGGASAGLAAAFSAPLSGVMFALEEIYGYVSPVVLLSTIVAAVSADYVAGVALGFRPVFDFPLSSIMPSEYYWLLIPLGIVTGLCGAFYNIFLIRTQKIYKKTFSDPRIRTMLPFLSAAAIGLSFPLLLGGGYEITKLLIPETPLDLLVLLFIGKFLFSIFSIHSGAPGGIFFPLLVIGATLGTIFANIAVNTLGMDGKLFNNFIILAMTGYFTAIVRAPITGILMLAEMSGSLMHLLPSTIVAITAYITASVTKTPPIYESLLSNMLMSTRKEKLGAPHSEKVLIELVAHHGSKAEGKAVKALAFPEHCLLISLQKNGEDITPKGNTIIEANDTLVVLCNANKEAYIRHILEKMLTVK